MNRIFVFAFATVMLCLSCKNEPKKNQTKPLESSTPSIATPTFNTDSAFAFVEKQVSFGFRVPGSKSHKACGNWIISKMKAYGAQVTVQDFKSNFFDKKNVPSFNIIASYQPELPDRIVLAAHWDTRMIGEKDQKMKNKPIMGADDGASGVANLIEMARLLQSTKLPIGVDLIFFDAEDNGNDQKGWCQGAEYWSKNLHKQGYKARFGILMDMVGAKNAKFGHESYSKQNAGDYMNKIWSIAQGMGYADLFVNTETGAITDDHYYVMANAGIPMVDIINRPMNPDTDGFGTHHHTQGDNLSVIDKRTLGAVGKVVTEVMMKYANKTLFQ
jgi:Zn-dependent M28 family amino/carboxypeptidase